MTENRKLALIEKATGRVLWEAEVWRPLTEMSVREIMFLFQDPLALPREEFVSGRVYFAWR